MIARVEGVLLEKEPTRLVVGVGGVGLDIAVPLRTAQRAGNPGDTVVLHTVLIVREDLLALYGFSEVPERALFLKLTSVSGVGPRTALSALSTTSAEELVDAIARNDATWLVRIPGIGQKTAERICVDLKDAFVGFETGAGGPGGGAERDAVEALVSLGFSRSAAQDALRSVVPDAGAGAAVEDLLKRALAHLNTRKRGSG